MGGKWRVWVWERTCFEKGLKRVRGIRSGRLGESRQESEKNKTKAQINLTKQKDKTYVHGYT